MDETLETQEELEAKEKRSAELEYILEAILDDAASEYLSYHRTKDGISKYAENGLNIFLSDEEVEKIFKIINLLFDEDNEPTYDESWEYDFIVDKYLND